MGLFKPAWKSKNEKKALEALDKISSCEHSYLTKIATYAPLQSVRDEAERKIEADRRFSEKLQKDCEERRRYCEEHGHDWEEKVETNENGAWYGDTSIIVTDTYSVEYCKICGARGAEKWTQDMRSSPIS